MSPLFKKLNLKAPADVLIINAPPGFEVELKGLEGAQIHRETEAQDNISFALVFVTRKVDVDHLAAAIAPKALGDPVVWFAYPKASSKKYTCDFNRDTGWSSLGPLGFEGVRQVAIDADWSALRFRRVEHIKNMRRDPKRAMTTAGREKAKGR